MSTAEKPDLGAAAIRGLRWTALSRPLIEIALFGSMVVLARLIEPAEFGRFAVALIVTELAASIPNVGIGSALVQRKELSRGHLQTGLALTLIAAIGLGALTLALASLLVDPVFGSRTADLVRLSTPAFAIAALATVPLALLRRRLAFGTLSMLELGSAGVRAAAGVGLAIAGLEAEALVFAALLGTAALALPAWIAAPAPAPRLHLGRARELLGFALPASLASISWVGFRNCDYALVGARLGPAQAGYYFRAYSLAVEYQKKIGMMMEVLAFPLLSRSADLDDIIRLRTQMVRVITIVVFPLLAALAILAPTVVPLVFGPAWSPAVLPTQILAVAGAATIVSDSVGAALLAAGRTRSLLGFGWAHFIVYAGGVLVFAGLGLAAIAAVAAVVHTAFLGVAYWLMLRGTGEAVAGRLWRDAGPATVSTLALVAVAAPLYAVLSGLGASAALLLGAVLLVGAPVYLLALRALFPESASACLRVIDRVLPQQRTSRLWRLIPAGARQAP